METGLGSNKYTVEASIIQASWEHGMSTRQATVRKRNGKHVQCEENKCNKYNLT